MASDAIALPLAPSFPPAELGYILEDSEAMMLLASAKFRPKAEEVIDQGLEKPPTLKVLEKRTSGRKGAMRPALIEPSISSNGGVMLYTSGTTNRPVSSTTLLFKYLG